MPKQFYTEKDIEDLYQRGTKSLQVSDEVVLTELADEKAKSLGFQLITDGADTPPAAPVRPYLSDGQTAHAKPVVAPVTPSLPRPVPARTSVLPETSRPDAQSEWERAVEQRIRSAVIAKLGSQVDAKLLDTIIHRVVKGIGLK
jgi:hypothetical protein